MAWHCSGTTNEEMVAKLKGVVDKLKYIYNILIYKIISI